MCIRDSGHPPCSRAAPVVAEERPTRKQPACRAQDRRSMAPTGRPPWRHAGPGRAAAAGALGTPPARPSPHPP
eukprot:2035304-Alexandrium_andersonii.AAC.1